MAIVPRFRITNALTSALARIERARGSIDGAQLSEDWVASMQAWARVVEAHHSTRLAGLGFTIEESERILAGVVPDGVDESHVRMLRAAGDALDMLREAPPVVGAELLAGTDAASGAGAAARVDPPWVIELNRRVTGVPVPEETALDRAPLSDLITWLGTDPGMDGVLMAGIAQCLLLQIRPFHDGNGRTARLLSLYALHRSGYGLRGLYSLSEPYDRDRTVYERAHRSAGERGDQTLWLEYFAEMLAAQMRDLQDRVERVVRRDRIARVPPLSVRQRAALDHARRQGGITIGEFEGLCPGVSRSTLLKDLKGMAERGLLVVGIFGGKRRYRLP